MTKVIEIAGARLGWHRAGTCRVSLDLPRCQERQLGSVDHVFRSKVGFCFRENGWFPGPCFIFFGIYGDLWLVVSNMFYIFFHHIWEWKIIPTDEFHHFSEGLKQTTNQMVIYDFDWCHRNFDMSGQSKSFFRFWKMVQLIKLGRLVIVLQWCLAQG